MWSILHTITHSSRSVLGKAVSVFDTAPIVDAQGTSTPARQLIVGSNNRSHQYDTRRFVMSGKTTIVVLPVAIALGLVGAASVALAQQEGQSSGAVQPCSLSGINPADHPGVFGNPTVAREQYGFVRGPNGQWQVIPNCESQIRR
jgi:hypothetical protein